jgi:serine/threonine-protein kinase
MVALVNELENYVLEEEIGRGDLTIVFRGSRKADNLPVAIKVVAPQFTFDEYFVRRFQDSARQSTRLEHPNIVQTYEAGNEGDTLFIIREFIEAPTLADVLAAEGPFSAERTVAIARQVAAALDYAHQKSIMHGDLAPKRIYLGPGDHVTVADFGQMQSMAGTSLVKQGYAVGTPEILAPERVRGQGPSRQSDLYSLGILCYQMLSGQPPFSGEAAAVLHAQVYEPPRPLHEVKPHISVPLSETVGRMLAKGLELRYSTGSEFSRALTVAMEGSAPTRVSNTSVAAIRSDRAPRSRLSRSWGWLGAGLALGALAMLGAGNPNVASWLGSLALSSPSPSEMVAQPSGADPQLQTKAEQGSGAEPAPVEPASKVVEVSKREPAPSPLPTSAQVILILPTGTLSATIVSTETTPVLTPTTLTPVPTPGLSAGDNSNPFTNLQLAHAISPNNEPEDIGTEFAPGKQPIYLFFTYNDIAAGTTWAHRWRRGSTELAVYEAKWPAGYSQRGRAWVFYNPNGGYESGPHTVTLELEGKVVGTINFVVQTGG